uniref:Uncharacterized protein n=1 Tax=Bicosoecida sp. CB-2014 TaxID=1486930 RepID=A0A7S1GF18_9STRA
MALAAAAAVVAAALAAPQLRGASAAAASVGDGSETLERLQDMGVTAHQASVQAYGFSKYAAKRQAAFNAFRYGNDAPERRMAAGQRAAAVARSHADADGATAGDAEHARALQSTARALTDGEIAVGEVARHAYAHYTFHADMNSAVNIVVSPRFGDPDLYVNCAGSPFPTKGDSMWSSANPGGDETVEVEAGMGCDDYQISVQGYTNSSFTITASAENYIEVYADMPISGVVAEDAYAHFKFDTGSYGYDTAISLSVMTGDADLYVACDDFPTTENARWSSRTAGGDDYIAIPSGDSCEMEGNTYFISVYGFTAPPQGAQFDITVSQISGGGSSWGGSSSGGSWGGGSWSSGGGWHPGSGSGSWWGSSTAGSQSWGSGSFGPGPEGAMELSMQYPYGGLVDPGMYEYYQIWADELQTGADPSIEGADIVVTFLDGRANLFVSCSDSGYPSAEGSMWSQYADADLDLPYVTLSLDASMCSGQYMWMSVTSDSIYHPCNYTISVVSDDPSFPFYPLEDTPQGFDIISGGTAYVAVSAQSTWVESVTIEVQNLRSDFALPVWAVADSTMPSSSHFKWSAKPAAGSTSQIVIDSSGLSDMDPVNVVVDNSQSASDADIVITARYVYKTGDEFEAARAAEAARLRALKEARDADAAAAKRA